MAEWIEALPKPLRDADPWLVYWLGVARVGRDPAMSRVLIERALAAFDLAGDSTGQVRAIASLMSGWWAERASLHWLEPYASRLNALLHDNLNLDLNTRAIGLISLARARVMIRPDDPLLADYAMRLAALPIDKLAPELRVGIGTCLVAYYWGVGDSEACTAAIRRSQATAERSDVPVSDRLWFWFWQMTHLVYLADVDGGREVMRRARVARPIGPVAAVRRLRALGCDTGTATGPARPRAPDARDRAGAAARRCIAVHAGLHRPRTGPLRDRRAAPGRCGGSTHCAASSCAVKAGWAGCAPAWA